MKRATVVAESLDFDRLGFDGSWFDRRWVEPIEGLAVESLEAECLNIASGAARTVAENWDTSILSEGSTCS
jgi:hypothetical protein